MQALVLAALSLISAEPEPHRQFDFWIGEWSVQNRDLQADGSWKDGDVTRARITPFLDGHAILEEWSGPLRGSFMNGFSLRSYDAIAERWSLVLFWTADGNGSFGRMSGEFRHGRGEFLAGRGKQRTRYTFSDALPRTVRWDSARSTDGGISWKTDWIMEFTRTAEASAMSPERLFEHPWKAGAVSPHEEARRLDWTLGEWAGIAEVADGESREARMRCALLNQDCLIVDLLEFREGDGWRGRLQVRGWDESRKRWTAVLTSTDDPRIHLLDAELEGDDVRFLAGPAPVEEWSREAPDELVVKTFAFDAPTGDAPSGPMKLRLHRAE